MDAPHEERCSRDGCAHARGSSAASQAELLTTAERSTQSPHDESTVLPVGHTQNATPPRDIAVVRVQPDGAPARWEVDPEARATRSPITTRIRIALLDPPYLGMASKYSVLGTPEYHPDALRWDEPLEHQRLMQQADEFYPDGWAYCLQVPALRTLLPLAPAGVRVCAWVKPWATWRPGAGPAHAWEPVLIRCGKRKVPERRPRDWVAASVGHMHTDPFFGAKPPEFSRWIFDLFALGEHPDDELIDVFPGSGAVTRAWNEFMAANARVRGRSGDVQTSLFDATTPPGGTV